MITVDTPLLLNALLFGTLSILIFLFPYAYYISKFFGENNQGHSYAEIIMKAFLLHILIVIGFSLALGIIDIIMINSSMKPSNGIKFFYGYINMNGASNSSPGTLWDYWLGQSVSSLSSGASQMQVMTTQERNTMLVWFQVIAFIVFVLMLLLPLFIVGGFFAIYFKEGQHQDSSFFQRISRAFAFYVIAFVIFYIHMLISSSFVAGAGHIQHFSFYDMMSSLWKQIVYP